MWCSNQSKYINETDNELYPVAKTDEFYRIWSCILFSFSMHDIHIQSSNSCYQTFGDGFMWAGCIIMHFLGQKLRFENFDFCYHLLRISEVQPPTEGSMVTFLKRLIDMKILNDSIFSTLNTYDPYDYSLDDDFTLKPMAEINRPYNSQLFSIGDSVSEDKSMETDSLRVNRTISSSTLPKISAPIPEISISFPSEAPPPFPLSPIEIEAPPLPVDSLGDLTQLPPTPNEFIPSYPAPQLDPIIIPNRSPPNVPDIISILGEAPLLNKI